MLTAGDLERSQRRLESRGKELAERARQKVGSGGGTARRAAAGCFPWPERLLLHVQSLAVFRCS